MEAPDFVPLERENKPVPIIDWQDSPHLSLESKLLIDNNEQVVPIIDAILKDLLFNNDKNGKETKMVFFHEINDKIKPFDLIVFDGSPLISQSIQLVQDWVSSEVEEARYGNWNHVGVILNNKVMDIPDSIDSEFYVLEFTGNSAKALDPSADMMTKTGGLKVQVRALKEVFKTYDGSLAYLPMNNSIYLKRTGETAYAYGQRLASMKDIVNRFYEKNKARHYQFNPINMFSTLFPFLRPARVLFPISKYWIMCSQLAAMLFVDLGVLPPKTNTANVAPIDYVFLDQDKDGIPADLFCKPPQQIIKM